MSGIESHRSALSSGTGFDSALSTSRQALYRYTAIALQDPRRGSWERLADPQWQRGIASAAELVRSEPPLAAGELGPGELPIGRLDVSELLARLPDSEQALNREYERAFGLLATSPHPPYETEYLPEKFAFQRAQQLADVAGFYRAFGLQLSPEYPERPDHIVVELEFMAFLIGMERKAAEGSLAEKNGRIAVCCEAQRRFLQEHLVWWLPTFAKLLVHEHPGCFYAAVGRFLAALVPAERTLLNVPPWKRPIEPARSLRPEECAGCLVSEL
jgi:TorA maturation chaperone TorD